MTMMAISIVLTTAGAEEHGDVGTNDILGLQVTRKERAALPSQPVVLAVTVALAATSIVGTVACLQAPAV